METMIYFKSKTFFNHLSFQYILGADGDTVFFFFFPQVHIGNCENSPKYSQRDLFWHISKE